VGIYAVHVGEFLLAQQRGAREDLSQEPQPNTDGANPPNQPAPSKFLKLKLKNRVVLYYWTYKSFARLSAVQYSTVQYSELTVQLTLVARPDNLAVVFRT
jgi:hypothetical protein